MNTQDNKLIAEFMGIELFNHPDFGLMSREEQHAGEEGQITELSYHFSWDWLMPVVEKIEDLGFGFQQYKNSCSITQDNTDDFWIINTQGETKLEATYKAVIEFIQWHNKQKGNL